MNQDNRAIENPDTPPTTILVADDQEAIRDLMREILEDHGYTVLEAANGGEALRQVSRRRIDLVVLSIQMPGQDGAEAIQAMRWERPLLKVLAVAGACGNVPFKRPTLVGANALLKKPFSCQLFIDSVRALLGRA